MIHKIIQKAAVYLLLLGFMANAQVGAEKHKITGKTITKNGQPIPFAHIFLENTSYGTYSNDNGEFSFSALEGNYTVVISCIGYKTLKKEFNVSSEAENSIDFVLSQDSNQLQEVEIIGRKEKGYKNTNSFVATKTAGRLIDAPQSVGYVTKELMLDQAAFRVNDVVKNISGVNQSTFYNDFIIRGHRVKGEENSGILLNGMRVMSSCWKQQLIPHIERVEVLKGPASALFGNASPGGVVNSVTKKPLYEQRQSVTGSVGSFNTFRMLSDFTGPMTKDKKLLYRLNIGYENSDGFRDLQFSKNVVVAPSFSFIPSDKTRLNFDVVYQDSRGRLDRGMAVYGDGNLYSVPISRSLSAANDYLNEKNLNVTLSLHHNFNENLSINSIYLNSGYDEDLLEHRTANSFATLGDGTLDKTKVAMRVGKRNRSWNNQNFNNYLNYNFDIGDIKNKLLVGYDFFTQELQKGASQVGAGGFLTKDGKYQKKFKVSKKNEYILDGDGNPKPNVANFDLTSPYGNVLRDMSTYINRIVKYDPYKQENQGIYIQNQITYKKLKLLLGVRKDYFTDYIKYNTKEEQELKQDAFIPRVGFVYNVTSNINAYGTWVRGYQPQRARDISNPDAGGPFDPLSSELFEVGFKSEWFDKKMGVTMALYNLTQKGTLYSANDPDNPDKLMQIGEEKAKGVEFDLYGKIQDNWSLVLNYAYNDAFFTQADEEQLKYFGDGKPNTPKHTFNMWTKYVITQGMLKGLGIGLGYEYVDKRRGHKHGNIEKVTFFPSYDLANAALYYNINKFQIQLNINNIFNQTHWVGVYHLLRTYPGQNRNIMTTVSYTF